MTRPATKLRIVPEPQLSAADALAQIVPELIAAETVVASLKRLMDVERGKLAKERGIAFLREEHVRREFGR